MIGVGSRSKKASMPSPELALEAGLGAVTHNLVAYSEGDVFVASTAKDKQIKKTTDALMRAQEDVASQISAKLDELHYAPVVPNYPADYTRLNFVSYSSMLPRFLDDLAAKHAEVTRMRNELLEAIRKAQDAAALLTAAKLLHEKAIEKLNASASGICPPKSLPKDPADVKPLVPTVKYVEVVETTTVSAAPAAATTTAHDDHGHGGHEEHGHGGHDEHGHGDAHATATAHEPPPAAAAAPEPVAEAPKAEAPAAAAPAAAEAAPAKAAEPEEDPNFVATWKVAPLAPLVAGTTNFMLASQSTDAGQLTQLAKDANHLVRHNVVQNPNTPKEVVQGLTGDESVHVRRAAKKRLS